MDATEAENRSAAVTTVVTDFRWPNVSNNVPRTRFIRRTSGHRRSEACDMLIAIDEPLYHTIYKENITKTTEMAEDYIRRINKIYQK